MVDNLYGFDVDSEANYWHRREQNKKKVVEKIVQKSNSEIFERLDILENGAYHYGSKQSQKQKRAIAMSEKLTRWI